MTELRVLVDAHAAEIIEGGPKAFRALRAVLDQHPLVYDDGDRCRGCWNQVHDTYERWPCATIRAITTALEAS